MKTIFFKYTVTAEYRDKSDVLFDVASLKRLYKNKGTKKLYTIAKNPSWHFTNKKDATKFRNELNRDEERFFNSQILVNDK